MLPTRTARRCLFPTTKCAATLIVAAAAMQTAQVRAADEQAAASGVESVEPGFCGFDAIVRQLRQTDPNWQNNVDNLERAILQYQNERGAQPRTPFTIPVVVHVLHRPADAYGFGFNISYDQIKWQIQALNAAFAANYPAYNGQTHGPSATNTQIQFCLATIPTPSSVSWATGPSGTECGVMRYSVSDAVLEHDSATEQPLLLSITHPTLAYFPFNMYLNIWLVGEICDSTSLSCDGSPSQPPGVVGYATWPSTPVGGLEGVVFRSDVFGDNSPQGNNFPLITSPDLQQGKILAHEVGHYLALYHTHEPSPLPGPTACVGNTAATCGTQGDRCCDTPATTTLNYVCTQAIPNTCVDPAPNPPDQIENYMSYSDDNCMNTFTSCQAARMAATLTSDPSRTNMVSAANLTATGAIIGTGGCPCSLLVANITFSPASPCAGGSVCFSTSGATGATSWSWNFGDPSSGAANTSTLYGPCHTFASPGLYTVTLTVHDALGRAYTTTRTVRVSPTATLVPASPQPTVCDGSQQCVTMQFAGGAPPWTAVLTDGASNITAVSYQSTMCWPVTVRLSNPTYTLVSVTDSNNCPGTVSGSTTFNVIACCPEMLTNGGFENGNGCNISPFTTQQVIFTPPASWNWPPCAYQQPTYYAVYNWTTGGFGSWPNLSTSPSLPNTGNVMMIDGTWSPVNSTASPPNTQLVCQSAVVLPSTQYMISFWVTQCASLQLRLFVNGTAVGTAFVPGSSTTTFNWVPFNFIWNSGSTSGTVNFCVCQVAPFGGQGFDYALDNISVRQIGLCNTVPCPPPPPRPTQLLSSTDRRCGPQGQGIHHSIDVVGNPINPSGYVTVGERQLAPGVRGLHVVRWDRSGSVLLERVFLTNDLAEQIVATSVDVDANCNSLVAGEISGGPLPATFAARLDPALNVVWARRITGDMSDGQKVQADWLTDGSAAITGMGRDANGNPTRARLTRLSAVGGGLWSKSYSVFGAGASDQFNILDLEQAPDGVIWVCGSYAQGLGNESAMVMPVALATGLPAASVATIYAHQPLNGLTISRYLAVRMDPTPGANNGDLLLAGYVSALGFPTSTTLARAARINRATGVAQDWDYYYTVSLVPGPSAIALSRGAYPTAPTTIVIAGTDDPGHRARTLDIAEATGLPIAGHIHGHSAPPYTDFRDITPGGDRTMIGSIETTAGAGQQIYFGQNGCRVFYLPTTQPAANGMSVVEVESQNESYTSLILFEQPVSTACSTVCTYNPLRGDMDCNGVVATLDVTGFVIAVLDPIQYAIQYPSCDVMNADMNTDGYVDALDIELFVGGIFGI